MPGFLFTSRSAAETRAFGGRLGKLLRPGDLVGLVGELGAGKTELVRGIAAGAGVAASEVSSPTFAIVATYPGRLPLHHADLYRLADVDELYATGFGDLLGGEGAVVVEWADRIPGALPEERLEIRLWHGHAPDDRRVMVIGTGERHGALAEALWPLPKPPAKPAKKAKAKARPKAQAARRARRK